VVFCEAIRRLRADDGPVVPRQEQRRQGGVWRMATSQFASHVFPAFAAAALNGFAAEGRG
jgi:hypothetical protein